MIDTSQAIRSFCKATTIAATTTTEIQLRDTQGGTKIKCNYAEVTCLGNASGVVHITPSSTSYSYTDPSRDPLTSNGAADGAGGLLCSVGQFSPSPQVVRTSGSEFFDVLSVKNLSTEAVQVVVNYGVVYTANPLDILKVSNKGS